MLKAQDFTTAYIHVMYAIVVTLRYFYNNNNNNNNNTKIYDTRIVTHELEARADNQVARRSVLIILN